jgi:hypothetical protein
MWDIEIRLQTQLSNVGLWKLDYKLNNSTTWSLSSKSHQLLVSNELISAFIFNYPWSPTEVMQSLSLSLVIVFVNISAGFSYPNIFSKDSSPSIESFRYLLLNLYQKIPVKWDRFFWSVNTSLKYPSDIWVCTLPLPKAPFQDLIGTAWRLPLRLLCQVWYTP